MLIRVPDFAAPGGWGVSRHEPGMGTLTPQGDAKGPRQEGD